MFIGDFFIVEGGNKLMKTITHKMSKMDAGILTPVSIFNRLSGTKKFLLESSIQHEEKGKFSFIGVDPYEEIIGEENKTIIKDVHGTKKVFMQHPLHYLKKHFKPIDIDIPLPFFGGAVGYIGYHASLQSTDKQLQNEIEMPNVHLMIYKNMIVFDHIKEVIYLIALNVDYEAEHVLDERLSKLKKMIQTHVTEDRQPLPNISFKKDITAKAFINKVNNAKKYIERGEVYQVVLSQRMKAHFSGEPFNFYRQLRKANPSPYMFYIDFKDYLILGASPESLIHTTGRQMITNPIAGTRARGKTKEEDRQLKNELLTDRKEVAEHNMLVNLSKQDLMKVCHKDSITVPVYMEIEKYEHVMHIVSVVHGTLKNNFTSIDALLACLPAGTVSGEPRPQAMEIINKLESKNRGVYGGSIGYIGFNYDLNMALAIRFLTIKDNIAYLQAGAGIVQDSDAKEEYLETLQKAKSLMNVIK